MLTQGCDMRSKSVFYGRRVERCQWAVVQFEKLVPGIRVDQSDRFIARYLYQEFHRRI